MEAIAEQSTAPRPDAAGVGRAGRVRANPAGGVDGGHGGGVGGADGAGGGIDGPRAASALDLLDGSSASLVEASRAPAVAERYVTAQLAALRAAAAVLAVRGGGRAGAGGSSGPRDVWELLALAAPELSEWASFFAHSARTGRAPESARRPVSAREADDLVRSASEFHDRVRAVLGLARRRDALRLAPASVLP